MERRKFFKFLVLSFIAFSLKGESKMEENWNPIAFDVNGVNVVWQEKYGTEKSETCNGLWENTQQYLLSWKDERKVYIEKSNINSIRFTKVKKN